MKNTLKTKSVSVFAFLCLLLTVQTLPRKLPAQTKILVDPSQTGNQNEPSIVVRPWDTSGNADGQTIVASWQKLAGATGADYDWDDERMWTSISTDGGQTWSVQGNISLPSHTLFPSGGTPSGGGDAVFAYRQNGTPLKPQLIAAFDSWDDDANAGSDWDGGIFVDFSSNDGSSWSTTTLIQADVVAVFPGDYAVRPLIATDVVSGQVGKENNAYVCWTLASDLTNMTTPTEVRVATIPAGSTTPTNNDTIALVHPYSQAFDDACAIAVASDGTVMVLWEERNTSVTPNTRSLYITLSTDGGSTWPTTDTVASNITAPDISNSYDNFLGNPSTLNLAYYEDYPTLTISKGCGEEKVFVAYTEGTTNPSDLYLTSAVYGSGTIGSWSTPAAMNQIRPNSGTSNSTAFNLQFQPALCPNGYGGVFLLYYSQQTGGTGPGPNEIPVIYETPEMSWASTIHHAISDPIPAFTNTLSKNGDGVGDFISMAWDPIHSVAHAIWTDVNPADTTYDVYAMSLSEGALPSVTNYNNQRKVVGDAAQLHFVAGMIPPTGSYTVPYISYKRTNAQFPDEYLGGSAWTDPNGGNSYNPSIALYSMPPGVDNGNRDVCIVWEASPSGSNEYKKYIDYVLAKSSNSGVTWTWITNSGQPFTYQLTMSVLTSGRSQGADSTDTTDAVDYAITPVVAPLIKASSPTQCDGFEIYWANGANNIRSFVIDTTGAIKTLNGLQETAVSDVTNEYFVYKPSCVAAYFDNASGGGLLSSTDYASLKSDGVLDDAVHLVWAATDSWAANQIYGTETRVLTSSPWNWQSGFGPVHTPNVEWDEWSRGGICPPAYSSVRNYPAGSQHFWELSYWGNPLKVDTTECSSYQGTDAYDPSISLDEYGRQRVTWRQNGVCMTTGSQFSAIVTVMGGPVKEQCFGSACGSYCIPNPTSFQWPDSAWMNSYANEVYWSWCTPFGTDSSLTSSPTITSTTLRPGASKDSVEVVWVTNESSSGGSSQTLRMADDIDQTSTISNGAFSTDAGEETQPAFGSTSTPYTPNGTYPNAVMGNASPRYCGGFVYEPPPDCNGYTEAGFHWYEFNPEPGGKASSKEVQPGLAAIYYSPNRFSIQLSDWSLSGVNNSNPFLPYSSNEGLAGPFALSVGNDLSFNLVATNSDTAQKLRLVLKHSDGSEELMARLDCGSKCMQHVHYRATSDDSCVLMLEGVRARSTVSTLYTASTGLKLPDVTVGTPIDLSGMLSVSDNPFVNSTKVELTLSAPASVHLSVLNVLGSTVGMLSNSDLDPGDYKYPMDTQSWPSGVYFVRLQLNAQVITKRIVKVQQ